MRGQPQLYQCFPHSTPDTQVLWCLTLCCKQSAAAWRLQRAEPQKLFSRAGRAAEALPTTQLQEAACCGSTTQGSAAKRAVRSQTSSPCTSAHASRSNDAPVQECAGTDSSPDRCLLGYAKCGTDLAAPAQPHSQPTIPERSAQVPSGTQRAALRSPPAQQAALTVTGRYGTAPPRQISH